MLVISLTAIAVGLWLNWRNDRMGYWVNLAVIGIANLIWIAVIVLPGYVQLVRGLSGPALFAAAAVFTTLARFRTQEAGAVSWSGDFDVPMTGKQL